MPAAIISGIATVAGVGMSIAGASAADASNKKAIEQRYKADKANWKFENQQRKDVYNFEKQNVAINKQNNENEIAYNEAIATQNYDRQMAERKREFTANKKAYKISEEDYTNQTDLNQKIANLALQESKNKRKEQRLEQGFANERNQLSYLKEQDSVNLALKENKNNLKDAKNAKLLANTKNVNALQQVQTSANLTIQQAKKNKQDVKDRRVLENEGFDNKKTALQTSKFGNRQALKDQIENATLARDQNIAEIKDQFRDKKLAKQQAVDELDDNTKYELFQGDNRIDDLQGELVTSGLVYQQERAAQAFQQQANNIEALQAEGVAASSGQRGKSARRQVASAMAAAGRSNAQLTDSILRGANRQRDKETNIYRRIEEARTLKTMQKASNIRRKGDKKETLRRDRFDKKRLVEDQREKRTLVKEQTKDKLKLENRVFKDSIKSMKTEKKQLMASLDASLSQYGFDIKRSKNSKLAAKQDFKANQAGAKEAYRSAARDYNLTKKEQTSVIERADQQQDIEKREYKQSLKSINKAFKANVKDIALDQYSADLTADRNRMVKPIAGPKPPKPIKLPKTIYQDPREPMTTPKPVKGVARGGAMLSAVGSGLGQIASLDFDRLGDALSGK